MTVRAPKPRVMTTPRESGTNGREGSDLGLLSTREQSTPENDDANADHDGAFVAAWTAGSGDAAVIRVQRLTP